MKTHLFFVIFNIMTCIINFYDAIIQGLTGAVERQINNKLEGRVLYYAMYTRSDKDLYYTCLYDFTSLWDRIKLAFCCSIRNKQFLNNNSIFFYDDVYNNVESLTSFMIDAVVVTYVHDNKLVNHILSYKDNVVPNKNLRAKTMQNVFIYAVVADEKGTQYDFTKEFNSHVCDIIGSPLYIGDFVCIFNARYKGNAINNADIQLLTLKSMTDNNFDETVFKMNDKFII